MRVENQVLKAGKERRVSCEREETRWGGMVMGVWVVG